MTDTSFDDLMSQPRQPFDPNKYSIMTHADGIYDFLYQSNNNIVAIKAPTGVGKTSYLPWFFASKGKLVRVSIPTTAAVKGIYNHMLEYSNFQVGFAANRVIKYKSNTNLVYATTNHYVSKALSYLKQGMIEEARQVFGGLFFLDEIHTNTVPITTTMGLLVHLFGDPKNPDYSGPKLVFATATLDQGEITKFYTKIDVIEIPVVSQPVETVYLSSEIKLMYDPILPHVIDIIDREYKKWKSQNTEVWHGIVFRPGSGEVLNLYDELTDHFAKVPDLVFYPAFSTMNEEDRDKMYIEDGRMKVVIGTNLLESSITIPNTGFVIDDLLEKQPIVSGTGADRLQLTLISKASSIQRRGRTGRTRAGTFYPLCSASQWQELIDHKEADIERVSIEREILELLDSGLEPLSILRINKQRYEESKKLLLHFGVLSNINGSMVVSAVGRFISKVKLGIRQAFIIYYAVINFVKYHEYENVKIFLMACIALACLIENHDRSYFYIPVREKNEPLGEYEYRVNKHRKDHQHELFRGRTDVHTLLNIYFNYLNFLKVAKTNDLRNGIVGFNYMLEYNRTYGLNNTKVRETFALIEDITETVIQLVNDEFDKLNIPRIKKILSRYPSILEANAVYETVVNNFRQVYSDNRLVHYSKPTTGKSKKQVEYFHLKNKKKYMIGSGSYCDLSYSEKEYPNAIICADLTEFASARNVSYYASIIVDA